jgi:hypothetical protein
VLDDRAVLVDAEVGVGRATRRLEPCVPSVHGRSDRSC